jgi:hypothetical protein
MLRILTTLVLATFLVAGCSSSSPSAPAPLPPSLTGTWSGELVLQGTATKMVWTLTQNGASAFGPVLVLLPSGIVLMNGTFAGSLSANTVSYTITVLPSGIPAKPTCTGQLAGSVTLMTAGTVSTLGGSYTLVSGTCPTPFSSGNFTLTKQ